ncbi:hypothetical protein, partial [Streptosporangium carneum]|uniref:hypothetical protein n=1 Tax=Streptosporangium carneum TaxID=47481 RepID=UPI0022F2E8BC
MALKVQPVPDASVSDRIPLEARRSHLLTGIRDLARRYVAVLDTLKPALAHLTAIYEHIALWLELRNPGIPDGPAPIEIGYWAPICPVIDADRLRLL